MPTRASTVLLLAIVGTLSGCGYRLPKEPASRPFQFETDRFAFANETVWNYVDGRVAPEQRVETEERRYTRRCFVLCRGALEFWKFARFEPDQPPLPEAELASRIRLVTRLGEWEDPLSPDRRIVFPGFANVYDLSTAYPDVFKENLGAGWPSYFRPGNAAIVFPPSNDHQAELQSALDASLALRHPMVVWLVNFPSLSINHAVLVFSMRREEDRSVYSVYDPNDEQTLKHLVYLPQQRSFSFEKTFYFEGGEVDVRAIYQGPLN